MKKNSLFLRVFYLNLSFFILNIFGTKVCISSIETLAMSFGQLVISFKEYPVVKEEPNILIPIYKLSCAKIVALTNLFFISN